jgi:hypothetical protein
MLFKNIWSRCSSLICYSLICRAHPKNDPTRKLPCQDAKLRHFTDKFSFLLPELEEEEEEEPGAWGLTEEPTIRQFPFRHHLTIIIAS